ncbi:MAG: copper resistance CopC/CopD family protein [Acidimicrobiia bacterium]
MTAVRRLRRLLLVPVIVLVVLVVTAGVASAHAVLENASPGPSTTITDSPRVVRLSFSESVEMRSDGIRVFDGSLDRIDTPAPTHPGGKGSVVEVKLPKLGRGLYTVAWRAVSADSHPVQGAYTFGIRTSATGAAASKLTAAASATEKGDRAVGVLFGVMRFGVFAGIALLLGGVAFVTFLWPSGRTSVRMRQLVFAGLELTFVCTVGGFLLQGPYTSSGGLGDVFSGDQISAVWDTRFGKVWVARLVLLVLMGALLRVVLRHGRRTRAELVAVSVVGVALAATPALAGHASAGRWVVLAFPIDVVHVLAMSVWIGGLVSLVLARHDDVAYGRVAARFSNVALGAVIAIVTTGVIQSIRQLEPFSALWDSTYGALLIGKLAAFAAILAVASYSRRLVHGRATASAPEPARATVPQPAAFAMAGGGGGGGIGTLVPPDVDPDAPVAHPKLSLAVRGELVFAAVVLAFTSVLVNTSPPHSVLQAAPVDAILGTGPVRFSTFFGPAESTKPNVLHVTAVGRNGLPKSVVDMEATLANPAKDVPPIKIPLVHAARGHYIAENVRVAPGRWTLTITAFVTDVDSVTETTTVTVG